MHDPVRMKPSEVISLYESWLETREAALESEFANLHRIVGCAHCGVPAGTQCKGLSDTDGIHFDRLMLANHRSWVGGGWVDRRGLDVHLELQTVRRARAT